MEKNHEEYEQKQKECGIEIGDTVKVLRKASTHENGWSNEWVEQMDVYVGGEYVVSNINPMFGYNLEIISYWFPFFVLEKVKEKKVRKIEKIEKIEKVVKTLYNLEDDLFKIFIKMTEVREMLTIIRNNEYI
jgi:hypothetical protein